jgi:hypothetical protein
MTPGPQTSQKNVVSLEKYRSKRIRHPSGLSHEQIMGDPDPPSARVWLQGGTPQASLENVAPCNAGQLLLVTLSLCLELAVIAQQSPALTLGIDLTS